MYGALCNVTTEPLTWSTAKSTNKEDFIKFLDYCRTKLKWGYRSKPITLVADQHSAHTCKITKAKLAAKSRHFNLLIIPSSSSEFNPVESTWSVLKSKYKKLMQLRRIKKKRLTTEDLHECSAEAMLNINKQTQKRLYFCAIKDMLKFLNHHE